MTETAIPVSHSFGDVEDFVVPPSDSMTQDQAIRDLADTEGWRLVEQDIQSHIKSLSNLELREGETMEQYGLRVYAATLCSSSMQWIIDHVRATQRSVEEREERDTEARI